MGTVYKYELRTGWKSLLIWSLCVGGFGVICILLFSGVKESMDGMAESFASMGAFAEAFGMTQLSIATLAGFYATEVGTVHSLGGSMFAAVLSTVMLSKEEDGHTGEFLYSLPVARGKVVTAKGAAIVTYVVMFNVVCVGLYLLGIVLLGEEMPMKEFFLFHGMQLLMHLEIAAICYGVSAFLKKNKFGVGIGIAMLLYAFDLMARVVPDLEKFKIISPFSYANAADILSTGMMEAGALLLGTVIFAFGIITAFTVYTRRDLAS